MGGPSAAQALTEAARRALRTLAPAPLLARAARAAAQELDAEWRRAPLVIGVGGLDVAGRTALLDLVGGGGVLDGRVSRASI